MTFQMVDVLTDHPLPSKIGALDDAQSRRSCIPSGDVSPSRRRTMSSLGIILVDDYMVYSVGIEIEPKSTTQDKMLNSCEALAYILARRGCCRVRWRPEGCPRTRQQ